MTFADNVNRLCAKQGTTLTPFMKSLGFSGSKATAINKGQIPNNEGDLTKIAKGLGCSVMDLFADIKDNVPNQNNSGSLANNTKYDNDINKDIPITIDSKKHFFTLLDKLKNMNDEQLLEMINYADDILTKDKL